MQLAKPQFEDGGCSECCSLEAGLRRPGGRKRKQHSNRSARATVAVVPERTGRTRSQALRSLGCKVGVASHETPKLGLEVHHHCRKLAVKTLWLVQLKSDALVREHFPQSFAVRGLQSTASPETISASGRRHTKLGCAHLPYGLGFRVCHPGTWLR